MKNKKGITLIALVVTIIILLILAGVSVSMLTGESSILKKIGEASEKTKIATEDEQRKMAMYEAAMNFENTTYIDPNTKEEITIPAGFAVSQVEGENTVEDGLVIIDSKGNEFVFIPINTDLTVKGTNKIMAKLSTGDFAGTDKNGLKNYEGALYNFDISVTEDCLVNTNYGQNTRDYYREPALLNDMEDGDLSENNNIHITEESLQEEYNQMINSVINYGGFFVSRYEMGIDNGQAISKIGKPISAGDEESKLWYGLYENAKRYYNEQESVISSMIWGSQYDAIMNFALVSKDAERVTSKDYGNYSGEQKNTGVTIDDKIVNIYDLAGNRMEWTLEARRNTARVLRGGQAYRNFSPSARGYTVPSKLNENYGTRFTIFIK